MSQMAFRKATKKSARLRMGLIGPPGSGKTYTGLKLATLLGKRIAVIDTEFRSSEKYADEFEFDVLSLEDSFHPKRYVDGIHLAEKEGFDFLLIDSLSHAWIGKDGGLDLHDTAVAKQRTKNPYTAWAEVTPHHQALVQALIQCKCHLIVTLRSKVEYVQEKDASGKSAVRKVGTAPLMREGIEYEFDVVGDLELETNALIIGKTRCRPLKGKIFREPGQEVADILRAWLEDGSPPDVPALVNGAGKTEVITGMALLKRLHDRDAAFAERGLCQPGALLDALRLAGHQKGLGKNIEDWPADGFHLAIQVTRDFEKRALESARREPPSRQPGDEPD